MLQNRKVAWDPEAGKAGEKNLPRGHEVKRQKGNLDDVKKDKG